jgi:transcriptional regulator with XRE-family HTH domain
MSERSNLIHRLLESVESRTSYIKAKLGVLVPSQIRSLRLQSEMPRQADLAKAAGLHQSRISMFETPGASNMTIETLARLAAAFRVGLIVKFAPFSEMLAWENGFTQDSFSVIKINADEGFLNPILQSVAGIQDRPVQSDFHQMVPVRSAGLAGFNDSPFLALGKISHSNGKGAGIAA